MSKFQKDDFNTVLYNALLQRKKITVANRIRSMTDAEMAEFFQREFDAYYRYGKTILDWLESEVEE